MVEKTKVVELKEEENVQFIEVLGAGLSKAKPGTTVATKISEKPRSAYRGCGDHCNVGCEGCPPGEVGPVSASVIAYTGGVVGGTGWL